VVNCWNGLPVTVDFSSLASFTRSVKCVHLSDYLRCLSSIFIRSYSVSSLQFCDMSFGGNCKYTSCLFVLLTCLLIDILYVISEQINDDDDDNVSVNK